MKNNSNDKFQKLSLELEKAVSNFLEYWQEDAKDEMIGEHTMAELISRHYPFQMCYDDCRAHTSEWMNDIRKDIEVLSAEPTISFEDFCASCVEMTPKQYCRHMGFEEDFFEGRDEIVVKVFCYLDGYHIELLSGGEYQAIWGNTSSEGERENVELAFWNGWVDGEVNN